MTKRILSILSLCLAVLLVVPTTSALANTSNPRIIGNPRVEKDRVTGRTEDNARVSLYRDGKHIDTVRADSRGDFTIYYDFDSYTRDRRNYRYDGSNILSRVTISRREVYGRADYNDSRIELLDRDNRVIQTTEPDTKGYFHFSYGSDDYSDLKVREVYRAGRYYSDPFYDKDRDWYKDRWDRDSWNRWDYRLDDFYLIAESNNKTSDRYYLDGSTKKSDSSDKASSTVAKAASLDPAKGGEKKITGRNVNHDATILVTSSDGSLLGSAHPDKNGNFSVDLSRALVSGEKITVRTTIAGENISANNRVATTSLTVDPGTDPAPRTTNTSQQNTTSKASSFNYTTVFTIGSTNYTKVVNGERSTNVMDVAPYIKEDRTMMPLRFVGESLDFQVGWNATTRQAVLTRGNKTLTVDVDSNKYTVDGQEHNFIVGPEISQDRTMLPISEIAIALGLTHGNQGEGKNIEWDGATRTVTVQVNYDK